MGENQTGQMRAVVMAGGQGTRLRPLTSNWPKPMVPVANKPMMEHILELLKKHDFESIVVTLQFLPNLITSYFGDGSGWEVDINYVTEEHPLGTAGGVLNAKAFLDGTFMVVSGDALTDIDLNAAALFHRDKKAAVTIVLKAVPNPLEFGLVITDEDGRIVRFLEKPGWGEVFSDTINTGIYIIEPEILEYIPGDRPFDFSKDLYPHLLKEGFPMYGYVAEGYWCDVGNLDQYLSAHKDVLDGKVEIDMPGHLLDNNIWVGDGAEIDESSRITGPVLLGNHVMVGPKTKIREYSVVGDNVIVKRDNFIHRSVIMDNSYIGSSCHIRGTVIGRNCDVKSGVRIDEASVVGDDCLIGDNAMINPGVLIFPFKTVDSRATVNSSIIWESRGMRSLFGKSGVSGLTNVDITPEKAVKLGMAYGSSLRVNSQVVTSRDGMRAARIIKRAFMSGLNATGVHVRDLEVNARPVNRFTVDSYNNQGGVDFRTREEDPQLIDIQFYDEEGRDLDQAARRKIEANYSRNDFRRAFPNELGEIFYPARAREAYIIAVSEILDVEKVRERRFKVVFDYGYGAASLILPGILGKLDCEVLSLNAWTDESRAFTARPPAEESLKRLGELVSSFSADMGIVFDNGAERIDLMAQNAVPVSGQDLLVMMVDLVTRTMERGKIAVPVNQTSVIDRMASRRGFEVVRTRVDRSSIMAAAWEQGVVFAGTGDGNYIFPDFMPAYDALLSFAKLLEMLAETGDNVAALMEKTPGFHVRNREIYTSWENKGLIMRQLIEMHEEDGVDNTDGIKVLMDEGRWVLILPDQEEPVLHLYAEGSSTDDCNGLLDKYESLIRSSST